MNKKVIAQMPPMPPMGGDPMAGGMPPPPGGIPPPPGGMPPPPGSPTRPNISDPLKSVGEILYDFNAEEYIALHPNEDEEKIAQDIWEAYGGNPDGSADNQKMGSRNEKAEPLPPEVAQKEIESTEDTKWLRLPAGKSITDITSIDEIIGLMKSLTYGTIKKYRTPPPPPGGGMPPMAASKKDMQKLASEMRKDLDKLRVYIK